MKLSFLGHSQFILEINNSSGRNVRLLFDSWLSDFAFGDLMSRNPRLNLDMDKLPELDGIYLTHPHCDHFDPYTLVEIYKKQNPPLLLPSTAQYLQAVIKEFIPEADIFILHHATEVRFFGITFTAYNFPVPYHTNEEDVMMLFVHNDREAFFYEADAALPEDGEVYEILNSKFLEKNYETRLSVGTRNELEALFLSLDNDNLAERNGLLEQYIEKRHEEMEWEYARHEEGHVEHPDLTTLPGFLKIYVGQGIVFPPEIDERYLRLCRPYPLTRVASDEMQIARRFGRQVNIHVSNPGRTITLEKGKLTEEEKIPWLDKMEDLTQPFDENLALKALRILRPLRNEKRNIPEQEQKIHHAMNERLFPFHTASLEDPFAGILGRSVDERYIIEIRYGISFDNTSRFYGASFEHRGFLEMDKPDRKPDEVYWANDLEDHLEGMQDLFSNTIYGYDEELQFRFWSVLGYPFLNSDIVEKKIRYHFHRARRGENVNDYVLDLVRDLKKSDD